MSKGIGTDPFSLNISVCFNSSIGGVTVADIDASCAMVSRNVYAIGWMDGMPQPGYAANLRIGE